MRSISTIDFAVECTLAEALDAAKLGDRIFIDDGKLRSSRSRPGASSLE
jgi:hypothetical protein